MKKVRFGPSRPCATGTSRPAPRSSKLGAAKNNYKRGRKPQWDDTVSDLTVHRSSKEELERRRRSVQSKNVEAARHDLYDRAKGSVELDGSGNLRPSPSHDSVKMAALQRALHGKELHEVLAQSDRAMAVVKDLFGDDPKRYSSQPNVTVAPHVINDKKSLERTLLEGTRGGPSPTAEGSPGGIRDTGVLELAPQKPALNELTAPLPPELDLDGSVDDEDTLTAGSPSYQPSIDLQRFQKLVDHVAPQPPQDNTSSGTPKHPSRPHSQKTRAMAGTRHHLPASREAEEESISNLSELSSIQQDPDAAVNTANATVDSEASTSIYSTLLQALPQLSQGQQHETPQPATKDNSDLQITGQPAQAQAQASSSSSSSVHVAATTGERASSELDREQGGNASKTTTTAKHSSATHPLQISHKMPAAAAAAAAVQVDGGTGVGLSGGSGQRRKPFSSSEGAAPQAGERPLNDLQKLVQGLELELSKYEETTGYTPHPFPPPPPSSSSSSAQQQQQSQPGTLSGITASLLRSVTRLTHYLRQSELQLRGEVAVRGQLVHTMTEQQNLMDALTTDMVKLKRNNEALGSELKRVKMKSAEDMRKMQGALAEVHKKLASPALQTNARPTEKDYKQVPATGLQGRTPRMIDVKQQLAWSYQDNSPPVQLLQPGPSRTVNDKTNSGAAETQSSALRLSTAMSDTSTGTTNVIFAQASPLAHSQYYPLPLQSSLTAPQRNTLSCTVKPHSTSTASYQIGYPSSITTSAYTPVLPHTVMTNSYFSDPLPPLSEMHGHPQQSTEPRMASTSPSNYAPSPPPLSVALQVPDFTLTPLQAASSTAPPLHACHAPSETGLQYPMHGSTAAKSAQSEQSAVDSRSKHFPTSTLQSSALHRPDLSMYSLPDLSTAPGSGSPNPPPPPPSARDAALQGWAQQSSSVADGATITAPTAAGSSLLVTQPSTDTVLSTWSEGFEVVTGEMVKGQEL